MMKYIYKYSGITAILVSAICIGISAHQQHLNLTTTEALSYLGTTSSAGLFGGGLIASAILMLLFMKYLSNHYILHLAYRRLVILSIVALVVVAIVPEEFHHHTQYVHWIAAWVFVVSLELSLLVFGRDNSRGQVGRLSELIGRGLLIALIPEIILALHGHASAASESLNALVFSAWVVYVTQSNPD